MSKKNKPKAVTGYSDAAKTAVQETTLRVQEMHRAIAEQSFAALTKMPLIAGPAQLAQGVHNAIANGVYAAIHHGAGGLLGVAAVLEEHHAATAEQQAPGRLASGLRSALNGAFGDHLAATNNRMAIDMALYLDGVPLAPDRESLRRVFPAAGKKICLFIHGLGCDEHCWEAGEAESEINFGTQLKTEFDYSPLYLRYNTGLPIADNGKELAEFIASLLAAWPSQAGELLVIGHSMGGLIALAACQHALNTGLSWIHDTQMLICLGSPNLGSSVERLGHLTHGLLARSEFTAPLGKIAGTRSQGIKDLRYGPGAAKVAAMHNAIAYRFLGASLNEDIDHPFSHFFGDGLVTPNSATAHEMTGDVQSTKLGGIGHMGLLTDARVYAQVRQWVSQISENTCARSERGF